MRTTLTMALVIAAVFVASCSDAATSGSPDVGQSGAGAAAPAVASDPAPAQDRTLRAIGDSIMVAAGDQFTDMIGPDVVDAEVGRTFATGLDILDEMTVDTGATPDVLIVALGTNNGTTPDQIEELLTLAEGVETVVLVNVVVPRGWEEPTNDALASAAADTRIVVVDWYGDAAGDSALFRRDGYHPDEEGLARWTQLIAASLA